MCSRFMSSQHTHADLALDYVRIFESAELVVEEKARHEPQWTLTAERN